MLRRVTEGDIPWLHQLCAAAYPSGYYDPVASEAWVRALMRAPNVFLMRGERAWLNAEVSPLPWQPTIKVARLLPVASQGRGMIELVKLTEAAIDWAREKGASKFYFAAVTGTDLGPLARRFGAVPVSPSYVLDLECATSQASVTSARPSRMP